MLLFEIYKHRAGSYANSQKEVLAVAGLSSHVQLTTALILL